MTETLTTLISSLKLRAAFATAIGILSAVYGVDSTIVALVMALIFIDAFTGILSSIKNKRKVNSRRMADTIIKILIYSLTLISINVASLLLLNIGIDITWAVSTTAVFLGLTEIKSIFENITGAGLTIPDGVNTTFKKIIETLNSKEGR